MAKRTRGPSRWDSEHRHALDGRYWITDAGYEALEDARTEESMMELKWYRLGKVLENWAAEHPGEPVTVRVHH